MAREQTLFVFYFIGLPVKTGRHHERSKVIFSIVRLLHFVRNDGFWVRRMLPKVAKRNRLESKFQYRTHPVRGKPVFVFP